ncbi:CRISPR-associated endonuclease Cas2 [Candidatus Uabimicrobium sp. HlEnr_7]|uniref:CRISPR-associated endonuclease Cas2 n=1 Tax=Candidatus Uabimicrobium helgolandensis TaxID=3095367 RepID=UPI003555D4EC
MLAWVFYDITLDKARSKVAKACEEAGIYRVQKSVFVGKLNKAQKRNLQTFIEDQISKETDSVYIFSMCKEHFNNCSLLGQAFDKKLISAEIKGLFL